MKRRFFRLDYEEWRTFNIDISVASVTDGSESVRKACASAYAARVTALEETIKSYLVERPIRMYGSGLPREMTAAEASVESKCDWLREPADVIAIPSTRIVHPQSTVVGIDSISVLDPNRPGRVHIVVDTCYPDPYFVYTVIFEAQAIVDAYGELR